MLYLDKIMPATNCVKFQKISITPQQNAKDILQGRGGRGVGYQNFQRWQTGVIVYVKFSQHLNIVYN